MIEEEATTASNKTGRNKKLVASALVAGAALGAWSATRARSRLVNDDGTASESEPTALVDWEQVRQYATRVNRSNTLTQVERDLLDRKYSELVAQAIPPIAAYIGADLPAEREKVFAFDRVDWINANIDAFRSMLAPFEAALNEEVDGKPNKTVAAISRQVTSTELGIVLGYLARRVLGQYDIALLGRKDDDEVGRLFFVEPNIQMVSRTLDLPITELRIWLALHEATHAFQFEAFPWVKPHFDGMLESYLEDMKSDVVKLGSGISGFKVYAQRIRQRDKDSSWIEALMTEEQRVRFNELQALMSVIEGYSNHVMNAIGPEYMPNFDSIKAKFENRQKNRSAAENLFIKATGLNLKMEQYKQGEAFIDAVVAKGGHDFAVKVWSGPENLPTMAEIKNPDSWIARIDEQQVTADS